MENMCNVSPTFSGYQLLGDSNMLRFAMRHSPDTISYEPLRTRQIGLCKSGLTVKGLLDMVKEHRHTLQAKVIVLIGTNDILHCSKESTMRVEFDRVRAWMSKLRELLNKHCEEVVFLTVPPIPCKEDGPFQYFTRLRAFNRNILACTGPKMKNLPLHEQFEDPSSQVGLACGSLFEETMGRGLRERPDGIHMNKRGLQVMADFIIQSLQ